MKTLFSLLAAMSILFYAPLAYADDTAEVPPPDMPEELSLNLDLRVTDLAEGQTAPFTGILLTTDAMTKIQYDHALQMALLRNTHSFDLQRVQLRLDTETALRLSEKKLHDELFASQLRRIESLEEIAMNKRPDWVMPVAILTSFVVGSAVTVGITYAVNQ